MITRQKRNNDQVVEIYSAMFMCLLCTCSRSRPATIVTVKNCNFPLLSTTATMGSLLWEVRTNAKSSEMANYVWGEMSRFERKQLIACVANLVAQTLSCIETAWCPAKQLYLHVQRAGSTHTEWLPLRVQHNQIRRHKNPKYGKTNREKHKRMPQK